MTSADLAEMLESSASDFKEANERAAYPIIEIWAESAINLADLLRQAAARLRSMDEALKAVLAEELIYTGAIHETLEASGMYAELIAKILAALQGEGQ